MLNQFEHLKKLVPADYHDTVQYASHLYDKMSEWLEAHDTFVASQATAGVEKPDGKVERAIHDTVADMKKLLNMVLINTVSDIEHRGDKFHDKNFKDGVR